MTAPDKGKQLEKDKESGQRRAVAEGNPQLRSGKYLENVFGKSLKGITFASE